MFTELIGSIPSDILSIILMVLCAYLAFTVVKKVTGTIIKLVLLGILVAAFLTLGGTTIIPILI